MRKGKTLVFDPQQSMVYQPRGRTATVQLDAIATDAGRNPTPRRLASDVQRELRRRGAEEDQELAKNGLCCRMFMTEYLHVALEEKKWNSRRRNAGNNLGSEGTPGAGQSRDQFRGMAEESKTGGTSYCANQCDL